MSADITAIILTMNEEKNIEECIKSINNFVSRIVVVDSGSSDKTIDISKNLGAEVFYNEFENYAKQFNWALDNTDIRTKWVIRIDADERLTPELCKEAEQAMIDHSNDNINGMTLRLRNIFLGRFIKYGGAYPSRKLMIFKYGVGRIENRKMDEHTILSCGEVIELKSDIFHYDFKNINFWINKHNWYATREMQDYYETTYLENSKEMSDEKIKKVRKQKRIYYKMPIFLRAHILFIYRYILKLGFLDGKEGFIFHYMTNCWYRLLVDSKIYEHNKFGGDFEKTGPLK